MDVAHHLGGIAGKRAQGLRRPALGQGCFHVAGTIDARRGSPRDRNARPAPRQGHGDANQRQLWIAPGLAHGFLVLSESADFLYKATAYYAPQAERAIRWDDPDLKVAWPDIGAAPAVSAKDAAAGAFASLA